MKPRTKITNTGGSYWDEPLQDTVHFSVHADHPSVRGMFISGTTILIKKWDSGGELHDDIGNTHFTLNYLNRPEPRKTPLTIKELIKDLLSI